MSQQQLPPQAQALMGNYNQLQPNQREQWVRNLARQAGISDGELSQMITQAEQQLQRQPAQNPNMFQPVQQPQGMMGGMMGGMMNQMLGKIMGGLKL